MNPYEEGERHAPRMPGLVAEFQADREGLERLFTLRYSSRRNLRMRGLYESWTERLASVPFESLPPGDRADWVLLGNLIDSELKLLDREAQQLEEMLPLVPFAPDLMALEDERRQLRDLDAALAAERVHGLVGAIHGARGEAAELGARPVVAFRAAKTLDATQKALEGWFRFYHGYDPAFTWWVEKPFTALKKGLEEYAAFLRKDLAGADSEDAIVGDPVGRDGLMEELERALIPYTPEELAEIARREMEWCRTEMLRAANDLGFGDDWHAALERVKDLHVSPGAQPALVRDLAPEAIEFVEERDLVTVPSLARECWRMEMMSAENQKVNPFFLGGECIIVSYPTHEMEHEQKRMSLRGNNRHFSRATVQHELIPGHYLQMFSQERFHPYRRIFYTPFWVEGWTLHWEMLLWDLGFARSAEDRIGMLFWRMHRCARVLFSLGFHLGTMTPQQCIEMLVRDVGHEPDNATAEVRRSFNGDYDPLYQCAYLIGGLQVRALHRELVGSGRMSHRQFHDAFLRQNCMPIAVLRRLLSAQPIERTGSFRWRFYPLDTPVARSDA